MKNMEESQSILSLNNENFRKYLLANYVSKSNVKHWKYLLLIPMDFISGKTWMELYSYARTDLASKGSDLSGYEFIDDQLVRHETIPSSQWPSHWMWVIQSNTGLS